MGFELPIFKMRSVKFFSFFATAKLFFRQFILLLTSQWYKRNLKRKSMHKVQNLRILLTTKFTDWSHYVVFFLNLWSIFFYKDEFFLQYDDTTTSMKVKSLSSLLCANWGLLISIVTLEYFENHVVSGLSESLILTQQFRCFL